MNETLFSAKVSNIASRVITYTKEETLSENDRVNMFLDSILKLQKIYKVQTEKIMNLVEGLEDLTWYKFDSENDLDQLRSLIKECRDFHNILIKRYARDTKNKFFDAVKTSLKEYKLAIDGFKEAINCVETVFFDKEYMSELNQLTDDLNID